MQEKIITLSDSATQKFKEILNSDNSLKIHLKLNSSGCSGYFFKLEILESEFDYFRIDDTIPIYCDKKHINIVRGTKIDWISDELQQKWVFSNSNQTAVCGCGRSFSIS